MPITERAVGIRKKLAKSLVNGKVLWIEGGE